MWQITTQVLCLVIRLNAERITGKRYDCGNLSIALMVACVISVVTEWQMLTRSCLDVTQIVKWSLEVFSFSVHEAANKEASWRTGVQVVSDSGTIFAETYQKLMMIGIMIVAVCSTHTNRSTQVRSSCSKELQHRSKTHFGENTELWRCSNLQQIKTRARHKHDLSLNETGRIWKGGWLRWPKKPQLPLFWPFTSSLFQNVARKMW